MNFLNKSFLIVLTTACALFIQFSASNLFARTCEKEGLALKAGYDFPGSVDFSGDGSGSTDTKMGFSTAAEYTFGIHKMMAVGGGFAYQLPRGFDESGNNSKFNFMDFYGVFTFVVPANLPNFDFYGTAHLGYGYLMGNSDFERGGNLNGGLYWAPGTGVLISKIFFVEILYNVNNGNVKDGFSVDLEYSQFTLSIGLQL